MSRSIEQRFKNLLENGPATIWASHGPVYHTVCDRIRSGDHVGSKAMRNAMLACPPKLIVSGHIHETCRDGQYKQYEVVGGKEVCIAAVGNDGLVMPFCLQASFVEVILDEAGDVVRVQRKSVPVKPYRDSAQALAKFKETMARLASTSENL